MLKHKKLYIVLTAIVLAMCLLFGISIFTSKSDDVADTYVAEAYVANPNATAAAYSGTLSMYTAGSDFTTLSNYSTIKSNIEQGKTGLKLNADVVLKSTLNITASTVIDLNGHILTVQSGSGAVITVTGNSTLSIYDSNTSITHTYYESAAYTFDFYSPLDDGSNVVKGGVITGGTGYTDSTYKHGGAIYIGNTANVTMYAGTIAGNAVEGASGMGGGVYVDNGGAFIMFGGAIMGNKSQGFGGGISTKQTGGTGLIKITPNNPVYISHNYARQSGGGIYMSSTKANAIDRALDVATNTYYPKIDYNTADVRGGGGLYLTADTNLATIGADFTGNKANGNASTDATNSGGGAVLSMGGNRTYTGNYTSNSTKYYGGAICSKSGNTTLSMLAGTTVSPVYSGNSAEGNGGAIYSGGTASQIAVTIDSVTIQNNTSKGVAGGVYAAGKFYMKNGTIMGNTASSTVGGVYLDTATDKLETQLSGTPVIRGNYVSGAQANLYMGAKPGNRFIGFTSGLTSGADVHIKFGTYDNGATLTTGYGNYHATASLDPEAYIVLDDSSKTIEYYTYASATNLIVSNTAAVATVTSSDKTYVAGFPTYANAVERFNTVGSFANSYVIGVSGDKGITLKLLADALVSGATVPTYTQTGNLDFNGKKIYRTDSINSENVNVSGSGVVLNMLDTSTSAAIKFNLATATNASSANKYLYIASSNGTEYTSNTGVITGGRNSGLRIESGATVNLYNVGIVGNISYSTTEGGGVRINGGTLNMKQGEISVLGQSYTLPAGTIRGNMANWGGGLFIRGGGTFNMDAADASVCYNGSFVTSSAGDGGAMQIAADGGAINITAGSIDHNYGRNGGGIFANTPASGKTVAVNITGGTLDANTAARSGGGVYVSNGATLSIASGVKVTNNAAIGGGATAYGGGGVCIAAGGTATINGATMQGNYATNYGGAILNFGTANITDTIITKNNAGYGGGIASTATLTMTGGTLNTNGLATGDAAITTSNPATKQGGGAFLNGGTNIFNNVPITGNFSQEGAGVALKAGTTTFTGTTSITSNTASTNGGGAYVSQNITLSVPINGGNSATNGGGVYSASGAVTLTGTISGNNAINGAGVYVNGGTTSITGTISGNTATANGGGLYVNGGSASLAVSGSARGTISNNAAVDGAGIYSAGNTTTTINGTVQQNIAQTHGGGVYVHSGAVTMNDGAIINFNTATNGAGGGVYVYNGTFAMAGATTSIQYNATRTNAGSGAEGAGVHVASTGSGVFSVQGGAVVNNNKSNGTISTDGTISGGTDNNIYLPDGTAEDFSDYKKITIAGALTANAQLNVTLQSYPQAGSSSRDITSDYDRFAHDNKTEPTRHFALDGASSTAGLSISPVTNEVTLGTSVAVLITAEGNETFYNAMSPAIEAFNNLEDDGKTLKLLANISSTTENEFTSTGILDLNGYALTRSAQGSIIWVKSGTLTITDSPANTAKHANTSNRTHSYDIGTSGNDAGLYLFSDTGARTISGGLIYGGSALNGGGIYVGDSSNSGEAGLILQSGTIAGNATTGNGGGVYVNTVSTFTMTGGSIEGNVNRRTAMGNGAGVYNGGTFTMTGGTIKMNNIVATQSYGGGVAVGVNGTFNMGGNAIITLNRGLGGGVYLINGASTALNMYGNAKIVSNTSSTPGSIGGVHMDRNFTGIISVQDNAQILHNVKIPQNSSSSYAYTYTDAFTVTDTDVSLIGDEEANLYLENGSGAKITVSGKLTLLHSISLSFRNSSVDTVITTDYSTYNNTTTSSGNKQPAKYFIFDQEDTVDHKVISLVNGEAVITLPTVRLDYTDTTSHSTYYGDFVLAVDDYNLGTLSNRVLTLLANSPVTSHAYLKQSGTLNLNDKLLYAEGENTLFTLTVFGANLDVTVKDEFTTDATAKYYVTDETTGMYKFFKDDGTLYTADDTETYITGGGIVAGKSGFLTNRHRYGAGLFVYNANVTLEGGTIAGNYVGLSAGASNSWGGGVGVINNGTFTMNGGSIEGNYSTNGGGIYVASGTTFTMNGGSIKNNKTFGGNGGGVYLNGGVFNMNGGTIAGNTAAVNGGGIFVNSGNLTIVAGTIDSNKAVKGAGVYINAGTQQIGSAIVTTQANDAQPSTYSVTISNNSYAANGSGIYFKGTKLTLSNVEISNNASSADGAGIYAESGEVQITNSLIKGNTTSTNGGAGIYVGAANVTINNTTITQNVAANAGGGIKVDNVDAQLNIDASTITENTANGGVVYSKGGGGLFIDRAASLITISNTTISDNKAPNGMGGGVLSFGHVTLTDCQVKNNTAIQGGGIRTSNSAGFTLSGGEVSGNVADLGGGVFFAGGNLYVAGALNITGNKLTGNANGTVENEASNLYIDGENKITVNQSLAGAKIGISTATAEVGMVITTGYNDSDNQGHDPAGAILEQIYFTLDNNIEHVLTLVPESANENVGEVHLQKAIVTVTIDGVETAYHKMDNAVAAFNTANGTKPPVMKLLTNVTDLTESTIITNTGTLDLNGNLYKVDENSQGGFPVITVNSGTLTITDSNFEATHTKDLSQMGASSSAYLPGGIITGGKNNQSDGGGVYIANTAAVILEKGNIAGNYAKNGAGVYLENGATLTVSGGRIVGNIATENGAGGGVYVNNTSTLNIEGSPTISENFLLLSQADMTMSDSNVQLTGNAKINITAALTEEALIGVSMPNTADYANSTTFTIGWIEKNGTSLIPSAVFTADYTTDANGKYQARVRDTAQEVSWLQHTHTWVFRYDGTISTRVIAICTSFTDGSDGQQNTCPLNPIEIGGKTYGDGGHIELEQVAETDSTRVYDGATEYRLEVKQSLYGDAATLAKPSVSYQTSTEKDGTYSGNSSTTPIHAGWYKAFLTVGPFTEGDKDDVYLTVESAPYYVEKAELTITANNITIEYGDNPLRYLSANFVGLKGDDSETSLGINLIYDPHYAQYDNVKADPDNEYFVIDITNDFSNLSDYNVTVVAGALHVERRTLNVSGLTAYDKIYDGTTAGISNVDNVTYGAGEIVNGDDEYIIVSFTAEFEAENANDTAGVIISGITLSGDKANNYELATTTSTGTAKIAKRKVVVVSGIEAVDREYNGQKSVTLTYSNVVFADGEDEAHQLENEDFLKLIAEDGLTLSKDMTGEMADADAGYGKVVNISEIQLAYIAGNAAWLMMGLESVDSASYLPASDYELVNSAYDGTVNVNILQKAITVTGGVALKANSKEYDATTDASSLIDTSGATFAENDIIGNDQVYVVVQEANFADKNWGTAKRITVELALSGDNAGNYKLASSTYDGIIAADITQKVITISHVGTVTKEYDGNTDAVIDLGDRDYSLANKDGKKDDLVITATGSFNDAAVGDNKNVVYHYSISGEDAGNYIIDGSSVTQSTGSITKRHLIINADAITAATKTYDGTTDITLGVDESLVEGIVNGETIVITPVGSLETASAGENKLVNITDYIIESGLFAGNYEISIGDGSANTTTVTITQAPVTIIGIKVAEKTFDGTTNAILDFSEAEVVGLLGNDASAVNTDKFIITGTGTFDDKNSGDGRTVTINAIYLSGEVGNNYVVDMASLTETEITDQTIKKMMVDAPEEKTIVTTYNGTTQSVAEVAGLGDGVNVGVNATVLNAGTYEAILTLVDPDNMYWSDGTTDSSINVVIVVKKFQVDRPTADLTEHYYNGQEQTYTPVENSEHSSFYTISGATRTQVGEQEVTITLNNTTNYQWATSDGTDDTAPISFTFSIMQGSYYDEQAIIWLEIVLGVAFILEMIWLATLINRKNKLTAVAPVGLVLLTAIPVWEIVLIIVLAVVVFIVLIGLLIGSHKYFKLRKETQNGEELSNGLSYEAIEDGKAYQVIGLGSCKDENIVIHAHIEGVPVTTIKDGAFQDAEIKSIYIPKTVKNIGKRAFAGCNNLQSVTLVTGNKEWYANISETECKQIDGVKDNPAVAAAALTGEFCQNSWVKE